MFLINQASRTTLRHCQKCCDFEFTMSGSSSNNQFQLPPHHPNIRDDFTMSHNDKDHLSLCIYNKSFVLKRGMGIPIKLTYGILTLWFPGLVIVAVSATITNIDRHCCRNGNKYGFISSFY